MLVVRCVVWVSALRQSVVLVLPGRLFFLMRERSSEVSLQKYRCKGGRGVLPDLWRRARGLFGVLPDLLAASDSWCWAREACSLFLPSCGSLPCLLRQSVVLVLPGRLFFLVHERSSEVSLQKYRCKGGRVRARSFRCFAGFVASDSWCWAREACSLFVASCGSLPYGRAWRSYCRGGCFS